MMNPDPLHCSDSRRLALRKSPLNGLDYLEVSADQKTLTVYLLSRWVPSNRYAGDEGDDDLKSHLVIAGGAAIKNIRVEAARVIKGLTADEDDRIEIALANAGDFSDYELRLVSLRKGKPTERPYPGFDPRYFRLTFNFKVDCDLLSDCRSTPKPAPPAVPSLDIDYLAKDYASFRRVILGRFATTMPGVEDRHEADLNVIIAELLSYVGDRLSYYQDAVATEAYLQTARRRISVRRHLRLIDERLHEGCNARTFVRVSVRGNPEFKLSEIDFVADTDPPVVFEPIMPASSSSDSTRRFFEAHNKIFFHLWGDSCCHLPKGATSATLRDPRQELKPGDILMIAEVKGPSTGELADADPARRHPVRLTRVTPGKDPLGNNGQPLSIVQVEWDPGDALPFSFCLRSVGPAPHCRQINDVTLAWGNIVLVDHGQKVPFDEPLGAVLPAETAAVCRQVLAPEDPVREPRPFSPILAHDTLTCVSDISLGAPASQLLLQDPAKASPALSVWSLPMNHPQLINTVAQSGPDAVDRSEDSSIIWRRQCAEHVAGKLENADFNDDDQKMFHQIVRRWEPRSDLLGSHGEDAHFVVETDERGVAHLRFGDGEFGRRPEVDETFFARCRIGNGPLGNVPPGTIRKMRRSRMLLDVGDGIRGVSNPLPAVGGMAPQSVTEVKLSGFAASRHELVRAVTPTDYETLVFRDFGSQVQRAAVTFVEVGAWTEVDVAIDPRGLFQLPEKLAESIKTRLDSYRLIGHEVAVRPAKFVPLSIALDVCVRPDFQAQHVRVAVEQALSTRVLADGRLAFFHPDNLSFGERVALSSLVAAVRSVEGVADVKSTKFCRLSDPDSSVENVLQGFIPIARGEIARLDSDPNNQGNGKLEVNPQGGR